MRSLHDLTVEKSKHKIRDILIQNGTECLFIMAKQ